MEKTLYLIMLRDKDKFHILYVGDCEKTDETDFFTKNNAFKCWMQKARRDENLYLCIHPMSESSDAQRHRVLEKIISGYNPPCNQ